MPAKSEKQRRFMGLALSYKRGEAKQPVSDEVKKAAESMTESELEDYASKPKNKSTTRKKQK